MTKSLIEKYKPKKTDDIPQETGLLLSLIKNKNNILIHGQTGSCKTSAVYAIAEEYSYEILELNASDFRNRENVENIIGEASKQKSLFLKEKLILIDEIDGISGNEDRGGMQAVAKVLETSKWPIIITTNNLDDTKLKEIKKLVNIIEFKPITGLRIEKILKDICSKEGVAYEDGNIKKIAINSCGDLRAAINDLQSNVVNQKLEIAELYERNYMLNITNALNTIFKSRSIDSYKITEYVDTDLDELTLWIDENLPLEFDSLQDLERAYRRVSKSDIFKGRIIRWQHWGFMHHQNIILCSGVSLSRKDSKQKGNKYRRPLLPLKIWQANMRNSKKIAIAKKISAATHTSFKKVFKNFNYYKNYINVATDELGLNEDERNYLRELR